MLEGQCTLEERKALLQLLKHGGLDEFFNEEADRFLMNDSPEGIAPEKLSVIREYIRNYEGPAVIPIDRPTRSRVRWAVAAAVAALVTVAGLGYYGMNSIQVDSLAMNENPFTVTGRSYVRIPDGTTALLDSGSTLTVSPDFGKGTREVNLQGKAFFDVKHDPSRPFIVRTGKIVTTVLGTAFLVDTDSKSGQVTITVTRGKVAVGDGKTIYDHLTPDQQLTVNTTDFRFEKKTANVEDIDSWQSGYLILDNVTMGQAAKLIGERFNVEVSIENDDVRQCVVSVWFVNNENLDVVMTVLSKLRHATYTINGKKVTVTGGTACTTQ